MSKMNGTPAAEDTTKRFASFRENADFLWQNAERLRGAYKPNEYDKVILPPKDRGKVQLLKPSELPDDWDPATDERLTHWETEDHLTRGLEAGRESAAAQLIVRNRQQGGDGARTRLPSLHHLRPQEARGGSACLQRARAELPQDHTPRARSWEIQDRETTLFEENDR
jgi:hypothetical protein